MKRKSFFTILFVITVVVNAQEQPTVSNDTILMKMAMQYRYGIMRKADPSKAANIYTCLSKIGNTEAMNELGKMYLNGDGIDKNPNRAMTLFSKSALKGNVRAMCNLALMYQKGIGVNTDFRKAYLLYKAASEKGSATGDYGVGYFLYKGMGVRQDYKEALKYLERGSSKGHSGCTFLLGSFYANGFGEKQNVKKAEKYFHIASKQGNSWTTDVTKHGLLDTIFVRKNRVKTLNHDKIPTPEFLRATDGTTRIESLTGRWEGMAYTYDWSNTKIVDSTPMACEFKQFGDSIAMLCYIGDSLVTIYTPFERGNYYYENKMKPYQKEFQWVITKCQYKRNGNFLVLRFRSLNTKSRDYRRPMVMSLHKEESNSDGATTSIQNVSFDNGILTFGINSAGNFDTNILIYSINGTLVKMLKNLRLSCGVNFFSYDHINLMQGIYIIEGTIDGRTFSKKITVK